MPKKAWLTVAILVVIAVLMAFWLTLRPTTTDTTRPLRIGILKHESSLPIYVADELGYFAKHGVKVELMELPPGDHMPALLSDRVDILSPTSFPTLFGVMIQHPSLLYAVFPGAEVTGNQIVYGLIVKSENRAQSIRDLRGGVIMAINPYTKVNIQMILNSAGIPKDSWPDIRVATREAALRAVADNTASAAIMDQPALAIALASPGLRLLEANPRAHYIGSPYWSGAGAVKQKVWDARRTEFVRLMAAVDEFVRTIQGDVRGAHQILAARLGLKPEIADQGGGYYFPLSTETVPKDGIKTTVDALQAAGLLESSLSLNSFFPPKMYGEQ